MPAQSNKQSLTRSTSDESPRVWGDLVKLYLGGFLAILPDGFGLSGAESANAHLCGTAVIVLSLTAIYTRRLAAEWLTVLIGAWLVVSPFVLRLSTAGTRLEVMFGLAFIAIAALEVRIMQTPVPDRLVSVGG